MPRRHASRPSVASALLVAALAAGCGPPRAEPRAVQVVVSVPPQAYFVERIAGPHARVEVMVPPGGSPETYSPSPRQVVALSEAALYVLVGHPAFAFETAHIRPYLAQHPEIRAVDMAAGMDLAALEGRSAEGAEGDPHVWLAPALVAVAADNIALGLAAADPAHRAEYETRLAAFRAEVRGLDRRIRATLAGAEAAGRPRAFFVYHPAWGYFAAEYGLRQVAIEAEGKEPSAARLIELVGQARREGVQVIFVQQGFSRKSAEVLAEEVGARVLSVDPLAYEWPQSLEAAAAAFGGALVAERPAAGGMP